MGHVLIQSMHGMGDNLHQRAVVRHYLKDHTVWLPTPWPQLYYDFASPRLQLLQTKSPLRTQAKNAARPFQGYSKSSMPHGTRTIRVSYKVEQVQRLGSVLGAMLETSGVPQSNTDFRLPVPDAWRHEALDVLDRAGLGAKPILLYRPLVDRTEWGGCNARNPDAWTYGSLAHALRDRFDIISIADIDQGKEWISGADIPAAVKFHKGELSIEVIAALTQQAALVFASPGFMVPMAQAVGTPVVCVFGGYEDSRSFAAGAKYTPYLGIDTVKPCCCFRHDHGCEKRIDYDAAAAKLQEFSHAATHYSADGSTGLADQPQLVGNPTQAPAALSQPG